MADFLLFCLASIGMTLILVRGSIFQSHREFLANEAARIRRRREKKDLPPSFSLIETLNELSSCPQCMGFWCGLFCGLFLVSSDGVWIGLSATGIRSLGNRILMLFCCGAAGSFLAIFFDHVCLWLFCTKELRIRQLEDDDHRRAKAEAEAETVVEVDEEQPDLPE